jgi:hypothetical protein
MQQLLGTSIGVFLGLTVCLVGGAAVLTGQAIGRNWKPGWVVVLSTLGLAIADRFLVFALFGGELLSPSGFLIHYMVLLAIGLLAFRISRVTTMIRQYPWAYERASMLSYRERTS